MKLNPDGSLDLNVQEARELGLLERLKLTLSSNPILVQSENQITSAVQDSSNENKGRTGERLFNEKYSSHVIWENEKSESGKNFDFIIKSNNQTLDVKTVDNSNHRLFIDANKFGNFSDYYVLVDTSKDNPIVGFITKHAINSYIAQGRTPQKVKGDNPVYIFTRNELDSDINALFTNQIDFKDYDDTIDISSLVKDSEKWLESQKRIVTSVSIGSQVRKFLTSKKYSSFSKSIRVKEDAEEIRNTNNNMIMKSAYKNTVGEVLNKLSSKRVIVRNNVPKSKHYTNTLAK